MQRLISLRPLSLAVASALVGFALPAHSAIYNENSTFDQDTDITMSFESALNRNAAIGVSHLKSGETFVVDAKGHTLTLKVGDNHTPNEAMVGIMALTSAGQPGQTSAANLIINANILMDIENKDASGSAIGVRNTGLSDITINGNLGGSVISHNGYVMGISNQKYDSVTTINGDVNLKVESKASDGNNMAYGIVAIGYPGNYNPNVGDVIDQERAKVVLNGNQVNIEATGWATAGIQAAQSGEVVINAQQSNIVANGSAVAGIDICNATGAVTYTEGSHRIQTSVISGVGPNIGGANIGISNRGTLNVSENVDQFELIVEGVGADSQTSITPFTRQYATVGIISDKYEGTQADKDYDAHTNLLAKNIVISVSDGESNAEDANIAGIVINNGSFTTSKDGTLNLSVTSATIGVVHGLVGDTGSTVEILGNTNITVNANNAQETQAIKADNGGAVTLSGANNMIVGDVSASNQSQLSFDTGATTIAGTVESDATSKLTLTNSSIELAKGSRMAINGTLESTQAQLFLNEATPKIVNIAELAQNSTLEAVATSALNDELGGDIQKFSEALNIEKGAESTQLTMLEGLVANGATGQLKADGSLDETTVKTQTNSLLQSTLELASSAPLALNRIMINDVRKRLGDIRTTNGTHGAWARYDGGKLSGEAGLENDFRTIQVGIDTVPTPDSARMGVAFSYTDSDAEYARGSADMKAYSLAMYATKMFDNGMFVDVIGRMGTADTDLVVDGKHKASMDNVALSLSGEMGWRFDLTDMVYVEPQAEVTYTYVNDDKVSVSTANYDIDAVNSLMGRVGFAAGLKCPDNFGNVYVRASAVHEFLGDAKITGVNGDKSNTYEIDGQDTWVEYGIGANFNVTKSTYVWADVERTTGGALDEDWRATVGVRYAW